MSIQFTEPTRANVKLKAGVSGPPGSGKTRGMLALATGLTNGGRIGAINSEIDGMAFQVGKFNWQQYDLLPPYDPTRLEQAIRDVDSNKLDCLIIDSLSLFWDGPGGLLDIKEEHDRRGAAKERGYNANKFANWGVITKLGMALMDTIMRADIHVLFSLRAERKFKEIDRSVVDIGWKPVFRAKHLFDPHVIWMLRGEEEAHETGTRPHEISYYHKDRIGLKTQFPSDRLLTPDFGARIAAHLNSTQSAPTELHTDPITVKIEKVEPRQGGVVVYWGSNEALVFTTDQGLQIGDTIRVTDYKANGKLNGIARFDAKAWEPAI